jgi:hypothetical protein
MRFHPFSRHRWTTTGGAADEGAQPSTPARQLADETEAFLHGTLAGLLARQLRTLPPWLLVNGPAHATPGELRRLAQGKAAPVVLVGAPPSYRGAWMMAERSVLLHLLATAGDDDELGRVQREVLVPLELGLIERSTTESLTLGGIVAEVIDALDHQDH